MTARTLTTAAARRDFGKVLEALKDGPVSLTERGRVVAVVTPARTSPVGCMAGTVKQLVEDIEAIDTSGDWGRLGE